MLLITVFLHSFWDICSCLRMDKTVTKKTANTCNLGRKAHSIQLSLFSLYWWVLYKCPLYFPLWITNKRQNHHISNRTSKYKFSYIQNWILSQCQLWILDLCPGRGQSQLVSLRGVPPKGLTVPQDCLQVLN